MKKKIVTHFDLEVYSKAFDAAMTLFETSKAFPKEERYSLTDQVRRSSRAVCANLAEGWRKRRYSGSFVSKLIDAEGEAGETQTWIQFAVKCGYLPRTQGVQLHRGYEEILRMLVAMRNNADVWVLDGK
jgi:four helix bundle protein